MVSRTRIVLIRHAESQAQIEGLVSGHHTCSGLSARGRSQTQALAARLQRTSELVNTDALFTSLLPRAGQTAAAIQPALGSPPIVSECAWCEIHPGQAEGLTWDEMRRRFPPNGDPDDPVRRRLPGMETWAEMYRRVGTRLREIAVEYAGGHIVVVAHGGTVGASFVALANATFEQGITCAREIINTSITEWCHDGRDWSIIRHNDAAHLTTN